ncbi:MAG: hypothetical protein IT223_11345 [Crocinitomicaceae bacterium]|nr:hypothetical protein [Crocinitomicaceae bacterium]
MCRYLQGTMQHFFSRNSLLWKGTTTVWAAIAFLWVFISWIEPGRSAAYKKFETVLVKRDFGFIRYDQNELQFFGKMEKWNSLFEKMDRLVFDGEGKISVLHIGGSHVQGGALTDRMRSNFSQLTLGTEGERGFFFPYKLAGTNSPKTIHCKWTGKWKGHRSSVSDDSSMWGMSGITATTTDSLSSVELSVFNNDSAAYSFNKVRFYFQGSENMILRPDTNLTTIEKSFFPECGYMEWSFSPSVTTLKFDVVRTDRLPGFFTFQGVYLGNENAGITYNSIGVNGAGTYSYLRCNLFEEQLYTLRPDMIILGIGVNDANVSVNDFDRSGYEARYDSLIQQFLRVNPHTCFMFITNNDTYFQKRYPNKNALQVREAMQHLAKKYNGAVYDLFGIMGGLGSIDSWVGSGLAAKDRVHFTKLGYELQADMMYEAVSKSFGDYLEKKYSN